MTDVAEWCKRVFTPDNPDGGLYKSHIYFTPNLLDTSKKTREGFYFSAPYRREDVTSGLYFGTEITVDLSTTCFAGTPGRVKTLHEHYLNHITNTLHTRVSDPREFEGIREWVVEGDNKYNYDLQLYQILVQFEFIMRLPASP